MRKNGFTLIELSIVLVIIGLIVGGVLVGQDLIRAAAVRAQISQIEKYNAAVNTFRGKYDGLPGDLKASDAGKFGFFASNGGAGYGDGNGVLEFSCIGGYLPSAGETEMFWDQLGLAGLINATFPADHTDVGSTSIEQGGTLPVSAFLPGAKIGAANYVYVWSGGYGADEGDSGTGGSMNANQCGYIFPPPEPDDGFNYFAVSTFPGGLNGGYGSNTPGLTVSQAYALDTKMDDGLPQTGNVIAMYASYSGDFYVLWAQGGPDSSAGWYVSAPTPTNTGPNPGSPSTCYDNGNINGAPQRYSMGQNNGAGINCALSFRFQ